MTVLNRILRSSSVEHIPHLPPDFIPLTFYDNLSFTTNINKQFADYTYLIWTYLDITFDYFISADNDLTMRFHFTFLYFYKSRLIVEYFIFILCTWRWLFFLFKIISIYLYKKNVDDLEMTSKMILDGLFLPSPHARLQTI